MATWNVTICSSASSLLKMSSKNRVEQVLGMAPCPQVSPSTIRGGVGEHHSYGANGQQRSASKRGYFATFAEQVADEEMLVEEEIVGAAGGVVLKKRRLTMDQVRFLESNFESENKLEPERKVQIAQQLGLQPRQVAVWFQNRRARSKSKQLERDFVALKADYHAVLMENEKLQAEVDRLTAQLREGSATADHGFAGKDTGQQLMLMEDLSPKTSESSSNNCPNFQANDNAELGPSTLVLNTGVVTETSTASVGNELGEGDELQQPCSLLADVNVNVNVLTSVMPFPLLPISPAGAAVKAMVGDNGNSQELPFMVEDFQYLSNIMQQACVQQLFDLSADSLLYDNGLLVTAVDDPWSDS